MSTDGNLPWKAQISEFSIERETYLLRPKCIGSSIIFQFFTTNSGKMLFVKLQCVIFQDCSDVCVYIYI